MRIRSYDSGVKSMLLGSNAPLNREVRVFRLSWLPKSNSKTLIVPLYCWAVLKFPMFPLILAAERDVPGFVVQCNHPINFHFNTDLAEKKKGFSIDRS